MIEFLTWADNEPLGEICIDLETDSASEKLAKIYGIGAAFNEEEGFYIPVRKKDGSLVWTDTQVAALDRALVSLCQSRRLVGWNISYDINVLINNGFTDLTPYLFADGILAKALADEERPHGLKEVAVKYLGEGADQAQQDLYANIKANGGKVTKDSVEMFKADTEILGKYCVHDCCLTLKLWHKFEEKLTKEGMWPLFLEETMELYRKVTIPMKRYGFPIDIDHFNSLKDEIAFASSKIEDEIQQEIAPLVQDYVKELLAEEFPVKKTGNFPKAMAYVMRGCEPESMSKKYIEKWAQENGASLWLEWLRAAAHSDPVVQQYEQDAQRLLWARKNPESKYQFNLGSNNDLRYLFFTKLGVKPTEFTEKGEPKLSADVLEELAGQHPIADKIIELKKLNKLSGTYVEGILDRQVDGVLYAGWLQFGTTSGRFSCIAEGSIISMPGGDKPIEDVKVGDLVYCFDSRGNPTVSKVLKTFDNGVQECVKLNWRSQGSHRQGSLICTPDHKIRSRDDKWTRADELRVGERVYHLRRGVNPVNGRARIYGPNYFMKNEEQLIKEGYFKAPSMYHAHHKDENKFNNNINNIQILSAEQHTSEHAREMVSRGVIKWEHLMLPENRAVPKYGESNANWISVSRFTALRSLAKAGGRPTKVPMDFEAFLRKLKILGIEWKTVAFRYNSRGEYLSRGKIKNSLNKCKNAKTLKDLGVGYYKLKNLVEFYGFESNHKIESCLPAGRVRVYDLEVEEHHNFIANEICVHNCTSPNLQNIPRVKDDEAGLSPLVLKYTNEIKKGFVAPKGYKIVNTDYSQLEPCCFASASGDPDLQEIFKKKQDLYSAIAIKASGLSLEYSADKKASNYLKNHRPELRQVFKVVALAAVYGAEAYRISQILGISYDEAQEIIDQYFNAYPGLVKYIRTCHWEAKKNGRSVSKFGRVRHLEACMGIYKRYGDKVLDSRWAKQQGVTDIKRVYKSALNLACNHPIQSLAAHIVNRASIAIANEFERLGIDGYICAQVHDEITTIVREDQVEQAVEIIQRCMETTTLVDVPLSAEPLVADNWAEAK